MNQTPARIRFKAHLGQANHFLVTSLVALHALDESEIESAPEILRTSWNPKSKPASVVRSRSFVMQSFLGWAVDSIDMYITLLDRKPRCIESATLSKSLQEAGRSVRKRLRTVNLHYSVSSDLVALIDILVTWRNNIFHEANDNQVDPATRRVLSDLTPAFAKKYCGLVVDGLVDKAESGSALSFKETASLINATHHVVEEVDAKVLSQMNLDRYCCEAVQQALNDRTQHSGFRAKYARLDFRRRKGFVATWLMNEYGLTNVPEHSVANASRLL